MKSSADFSLGADDPHASEARQSTSKASNIFLISNPMRFVQTFNDPNFKPIMDAFS